MPRRRIPFYHEVIVRDCSRVEGSPHRKNQLDPLRSSAAVHEGYRQPNGRTDRFTVAWTRRTQSIKKGVSAARLVTGVPQCDHITPILQQLHWLPVRQRVLFKIAVLVFQCLAGQALSYLSDDCQPVSDSRPCCLRSSDSLTCVVRRVHNTYGARCFATEGLRVCNFLLAELQSCDSLRQFKRRLKTFLFGSWDYGAL